MRDEQGRQVRLCKILLGLDGPVQREPAFPRRQREQPFGQGLESLAFPVAVEIPRNGGFIPVQEPQHCQKQADKLRQKPDQNHHQKKADERLQRTEREFVMRDGDADTTARIQQKARAQCQRGDYHQKQQNLGKRPDHPRPPSVRGQRGKGGLRLDALAGGDKPFFQRRPARIGHRLQFGDSHSDIPGRKCRLGPR